MKNTDFVGMRQEFGKFFQFFGMLEIGKCDGEGWSLFFKIPTNVTNEGLVDFVDN